ncbi:hypothetical protein [Candidatus Phyllobacterium onerii]|uniref:hypothetical protein n=1 Tax=Candidatus Phyllobacterium onerii TaxID=3020828 RepID=UPI00232FF590|nr:hypothetical protein [Phyllobacterium sp. IY22]
MRLAPPHCPAAGRDYPHPRNKGHWLGKPFKPLEYAQDSDITKEIVDTQLALRVGGT